MEGLDTIVADIAAEMAEHAARGKVADYIPDLAAVSPQQFGIAVYSPLLDERGHSVRGIAVCRELSERFGLHMFDALLGNSRF